MQAGVPVVTVQPLGNCLRDKTIRAVIGAKSYPARGTGKADPDGTGTSRQDKEVFVTDSVAQGATTEDTDRYVVTLTSLVSRVQDCQEDPAQGIRHAPARHVDAGGGATAVSYATATPTARATAAGSRWSGTAPTSASSAWGRVATGARPRSSGSRRPRRPGSADPVDVVTVDDGSGRCREPG